jgi:hypothetical protein
MTLSVAPDYLIPSFRIRLGDLDSTAYRYLDEWLKTALILAVKGLSKYWNYRYLIDNSNRVYRNPHQSFLFAEPPVIQNADEDLIILMANIILLEGSLENSAWSATSWRDAEIAFSNLEQFRTRDSSLTRLINELNSKILPPTKRLAWAVKQSLPGFQKNQYERIDETA